MASVVEEKPPTGTSSNAQANVLRAGKSPVAPDGDEKGKNYETRNWSLFFFFRIMRQSEMAETGRRLRAVKPLEEADAGPSKGFLRNKVKSASGTLKLDFAFPAVLNGRSSGKDGKDAPAQAFLNWLKVLVGGDCSALIESAKDLSASLMADGAPAQGQLAELGIETGPEAINEISRQLARDFKRGKLDDIMQMARGLGEILDCTRAHYSPIMSALRESIDSPTDDFPHGPLARMILYELLRQGAPLFTDGALPVLRAEEREEKRRETSESLDRTPITLAFSFSGLRKLNIDEDTLASFPEPFKEGMAARARRLGDVGRNAPENWEGEFGLRSLNGYFTGGSNLNMPLTERFWKALRNEVRLFNDPTLDEGSELRAWIGLLFRLVGLEVLQIEVGQDPYEVDYRENPDGLIKPSPHRLEHFGFRDGISQPFVDLGLGASLPGGGTADRLGTWKPVAPGEIFLDREDESGQNHGIPVNRELRAGSTYLVFRKLEQDVEGFRAFLEQQRPNQSLAQKKLAAQFFGRWPNGTSLVHSPYSERSTVGAENEAKLNDFRYAADDPSGRKCPLGAHVRRSNPRDIGGRNDVRHHRILRRGMAYGGPLLADGQADDGEKRGILFIAANARIDLQFEVIQGDWLNGGEFLGQAGLGRCPIAGAQDGSLRSTFLEAGAVAPVTGLPNFVTMRGGEYFFAPGMTALTMISQSKDFHPNELPYEGQSIDVFATPSLFNEERLKQYWREHLGAGRPVRLGAGDPRPGVQPPEKVTFVGRHDQVKKVLGNEPVDLADETKGVYFSVEPYRTAGRRITRGEEFLFASDLAGSQHRRRLLATLNAAWDALDPAKAAAAATPSSPSTPERVSLAAAKRLEATLRRSSGTRRLDLVDDLAAEAAYGVLEEVLGIKGPAWLTELAGALPFSRQHVGNLPRDWIAAFKGERPTDPGMKTMQIWSTFLLAELTGNHLNQQPLQAVARQAGTEMLNHIDQSLAEARARGRQGPPSTLVEAFLANGYKMALEAQGQLPPSPNGGLFQEYRGLKNWQDVYQKDVAILLLEAVGTTLAAVPLTFGSVMTTLLDLRIDLSMLLPRLSPEGVVQVIYEAERLNPNNPIRPRRCMAAMAGDKALSSIEPGDFVAAVIALANMDRYVFWNPKRFSLGRHDPLADDLAPEQGSTETLPRDLKNYLLFGVHDNEKRCWGRDRVALPILMECLRACGRLQGLRRVAGPGGEPQKMGSVTVGLPARFTRILSTAASRD